MKVSRSLGIFTAFFGFLFFLAGSILFIGALFIEPNEHAVMDSRVPASPMAPEAHDHKYADPDTERSNGDFSSLSKENGSIYNAINEAIDEVEKK